MHKYLSINEQVEALEVLQHLIRARGSLGQASVACRPGMVLSYLSRIKHVSSEIEEIEIMIQNYMMKE